jgi:NADPH2:quinone reductase
MSMRCVSVTQFRDLDRAEIVEAVDPVPAAGEVLVEIHAAPVNYVDAITLRGEYQFKPALPYTPGKGPAGVIVALGGGVETLKVGDRVLAMVESGGYADMVCVSERQAYRLPDSMPFADAASMSLAFDTAWMALRERARIQAGDRVLVLGANGAVGAAATTLARAMGASQVLAGVSSPARFARAKQAGADSMVDLSESELRESLRRQVFAATDGHGVDVVIDPLGGDPFDGAIRALAWRGRMVVIGFAAGRIPTLKANYVLLKNIEVSGLQISDYRKRMPELVAECYREVFQFYSEGMIQVPPTTTMPLAEWKHALRLLESRSADSRLVLLPQRTDQ